MSTLKIQIFKLNDEEDQVIYLIILLFFTEYKEKISFHYNLISTFFDKKPTNLIII